jgi:hypothetical protein
MFNLVICRLFRLMCYGIFFPVNFPPYHGKAWSLIARGVAARGVAVVASEREGWQRRAVGTGRVAVGTGRSAHA